MKTANLSSMSIFSEPATLNGHPIRTAIDDLSASSYVRPGGTAPGVESSVFVLEDEFYAAGGKKGSAITFKDGKTSIVQKITYSEGVLLLQLAPFRP
jgi:hypothetical protein